MHPSGREYWRFRWQDGDGKHHDVTRADRAEAIEEARTKARAIHNGSRDLSKLSNSQVDLCKAFLDLEPTWEDVERLRSSKTRALTTIGDAVEQFKSWKLSGGGELTTHLRLTFADLLKLSGQLGEDTPLASITAGQIQGWYESYDVKAKRRRDYRAAAVMLWKWAAKQEILVMNGPYTAADKTPPPKLHRGPVRILGVEEMRFLLEKVSPEFLPWLVLCGFSGLRAAEVSHFGKPPLTWAMIKLDQGVIEIPAAMSKNRKRKLIPILPTLKAWLETFGKRKGPVIPCPSSKEETGRLGKLMDEKWDRSEGWSTNVLRHTYGSARVAITKNIGEVSLEMDNSPAVIKEHYLEAMHKEQAEAYFSLLPEK
jgi:hypothetical protein